MLAAIDHQFALVLLACRQRLQPRDGRPNGSKKPYLTKTRFKEVESVRQRCNIPSCAAGYATYLKVRPVSAMGFGFSYTKSAISFVPTKVAVSLFFGIASSISLTESDYIKKALDFFLGLENEPVAGYDQQIRAFVCLR